MPYAIWQLDGEVKVVAADGTAIEPFNDARFLRLPHVVGKEANLRVKEYATLLEAVPELGAKVRAGTLVAGRRWDLKLMNGVDLKLPEEGAEEALRRFWTASGRFLPTRAPFFRRSMSAHRRSSASSPGLIRWKARMCSRGARTACACSASGIRNRAASRVAR